MKPGGGAPETALATAGVLESLDALSRQVWRQAASWTGGPEAELGRRLVAACLEAGGAVVVLASPGLSESARAAAAAEVLMALGRVHYGLFLARRLRMLGSVPYRRLRRLQEAAWRLTSGHAAAPRAVSSKGGFKG